MVKNKAREKLNRQLAIIGVRINLKVLKRLVYQSQKTNNTTKSLILAQDER